MMAGGVSRRDDDRTLPPAPKVAEEWTSAISRLGERFGGVTGQAVSRAAHEIATRLATERPLSRRVSRCEQALACEAEK